jgi:hypothetical protein
MSRSSDAECWRVAKRLFLQVIELDERERVAFLARSCAGRAALRAEVGALIEAHSAAGDRLERFPLAPFAEEKAGTAAGPGPAPASDGRKSSSRAVLHVLKRRRKG